MSTIKQCALCKQEIKGYGHNGSPLVDGKVCDKCNDKVVAKRVERLWKQEEVSI